MITDARALRPMHVPQELACRDGQIDHLSTALCPVADGGFAHNACLFGPSGAGKTTLAKFTLQKLEREALGFQWGYVSCVAHPSRTGALFSLVRDAGLGADLRREGAHEGTAFDRLRECDDQVILVLDEVDVLDEPKLIQALHDTPGVALVLISADENHFLAGLDEQVRSRIRSSRVIRLDKYSHDELVTILDRRIDHGLVASRVTDDAVDRMADLAAGDARRAIALLRESAQFVEQTDRQKLTSEVVDRIEADAEADMREQRVSELGTHQRVLYEIIREAGRIDARTLRARYENRVANPRAASTRRTYLKSLERYGLIEAVGTSSDREYLVVGERKETAV